MRRALGPATLVLAVTLAAAPGASAHVAPSVDDNNRYIKLTPAADRVRLAYTVFFGEVPGAQTRPGIDKNKDRRISDDEAQAFGTDLAAEVAPMLELTIDGRTQPVRWTTVAVGMGAPDVAAGSFSVDMIAWVCLPTARGTHALGIRDRFRVPHPGETEIKVEDSPGVMVTHTRIGTAADPANDYRFAGPGGPLMDDGLEVTFTASDAAPLTSDGTCAGVAGKRGRPRGVVIAIAAGITVVAAGVGWVVSRRRRKG